MKTCSFTLPGSVKLQVGCLWAVAILKSLLCLSAGALQESRGYSFLWTRSCSFFLTEWQLAPAGLRSYLVTDSLLRKTDTDWTCWLTVDARVRKHKHRLKLTQTAATQYSRSTLSTNSTLLAAPASNDGRRAASLAAVPWRHHMLKKRYLRVFSRNCPIRTALTFPCRHLRLCLSQT